MAARNRSNAKPRPFESATLFAALGDPTRLGLVARLCERGPMSIAHLTAESSVTRQAVSKHLLVMQQAGLVQCHRRGRESVWRLDPQRLSEARAHLKRISQQWDEALERLQAFVEE